jgi:hypothetical protein
MKSISGFLFGVVFWFSAACSAQVLNIEQERIHTDTTGWSGNARASFDLVQNQRQSLSIGARTHLQHKSLRTLVLLVTDYSLIRAGGSDFTNAGIAHLRFNRKLSGRITAEAFVQAQSNKVLRVRFRGLAGAGLRAAVVKTERFRLYAAALPMLEVEGLEGASSSILDGRLSAYGSWTWKAADPVTVVQTTYFQPLFRDAGDFRISSQTDFLFRVSGRFSVVFSMNYAFDSRPPAGVARDVYSLRNSFSLDFGG